MAKYTVLAARTQEAVLDGQSEVDFGFDTLAEAKAYARRTLTDEYMRSGEMSEPFRYAQVVRDGECVADFFRKD